MTLSEMQRSCGDPPSLLLKLIVALLQHCQFFPVIADFAQVKSNSHCSYGATHCNAK
jgi:hypothetical protein